MTKREIEDLVDKLAAESLAPSVPKETFEKTEGRDEAKLYSVSSTLTTADDVFKHAGYDPRIWEVVESTAKSYQCPMKLGNKTDGFHATKVELWGITVKVRRRAPKPVTDAVEALLRDTTWQPVFPKKPRQPRADRHLLMMGLYDHHFGKYGWHEDCGEDYDTNLAVEAYANGVADLLAKSSPYNIEAIDFPIGQDFFQANNWFSETTKGTPVDSDGRFMRTYRLAFKCVVDAINQCLAVAPVRLRWVPGNHDTATSWYLFECLRSWFRNAKHVDAGEDTKERQYISYGVNLIGLAHGDKIANKGKRQKLPSLVALMASEAKDLWAKSTYREWLLGHLHSAGETLVMTLDEEHGVRVRHLPSLSGTDKWHFDNGFIGRRACEGLLYSRDDGFAGLVSANVRN